MNLIQILWAIHAASFCVVFGFYLLDLVSWQVRGRNGGVLKQWQLDLGAYGTRFGFKDCLGILVVSACPLASEVFAMFLISDIRWSGIFKKGW